MNIFTLSALFLFLGACASQKQTAPAHQAADQHKELQTTIQDSNQRLLTGKNIFIIVLKDFLNSESFGDYPGLKSEVEKILIARGFNLVKTPRKAHTILFITLQKYAWTNGEWVFTSDLSKRNTKQTFFERIYFSTSIYEYGKRPLGGPTVRVGADSEYWVGHYPKFISSLPDYLDSLGLKVPAANKSMKGDPGCVPRFGLDLLTKSVDDKKKIIATKVVPRGPAVKAGIKNGDEILSIDSSELSNGIENPEFREVYEKSILVPVKFQRGDKIFRGNLKSSIQCNNDLSYQ